MDVSQSYLEDLLIDAIYSQIGISLIFIAVYILLAIYDASKPRGFNSEVRTALSPFAVPDLM
jgi:hypothetical protein